MKATKDVKNKSKETPAPAADKGKAAAAPATGNEKAAVAPAPAPASTEEGKVYLSDATRGFEITSKDKMYTVDRI